MSHILLPIIILCAILLFGFGAGRRIGIRQGQRISKAQTPLRLRAQAYGSGVCPICGSRAEQIVQCEENG